MRVFPFVTFSVQAAKVLATCFQNNFENDPLKMSRELGILTARYISADCRQGKIYSAGQANIEFFKKKKTANRMQHACNERELSLARVFFRRNKARCLRNFQFEFSVFHHVIALSIFINSCLLVWKWNIYIFLSCSPAMWTANQLPDYEILYASICLTR